MKTRQALFATAAAALLTTLPAEAALTISNAKTKDVHCAGGHCAARAFSAVLNATELQDMLASGDVSVDAKRAGIIEVEVPLHWSGPATLGLIGLDFIAIDAPVKADGGNVTIESSWDGNISRLRFGLKGSIDFTDMSSALTINHIAYKLEKDIAGLAADAQANPDGAFALAGNYDASADGIYAQAPIQHSVARFEGLNHTISGLRIDDPDQGDNVGLFRALDEPLGSLVSNLRLSGIDIRGSNASCVGGVVGNMSGGLIKIAVSGTVIGGGSSSAGGVAGCGVALVDRVMSRADVSGNVAGGIIGRITSTPSRASQIDNSFATGTVTAVHGQRKPIAGGLVGWLDGRADSSYATGPVRGRGLIGGFVGKENGGLQNDYWDTTTSGVQKGCGKSTFQCSGVTGMTTQELQAGLPAGFQIGVWSEDAAVNDGLPYIYELPPKR